MQFNRAPAELVALARRYLATPSINFHDDFKVMGIQETAAVQTKPSVIFALGRVGSLMRVSVRSQPH